MGLIFGRYRQINRFLIVMAIGFSRRVLDDPRLGIPSRAQPWTRDNCVATGAFTVEADRAVVTNLAQTAIDSALTRRIWDLNVSFGWISEKEI